MGKLASPFTGLGALKCRCDCDELNESAEILDNHYIIQCLGFDKLSLVLGFDTKDRGGSEFIGMSLNEARQWLMGSVR
jgi:hypothetical protein